MTKMPRLLMGLLLSVFASSAQPPVPLPAATISNVIAAETNGGLAEFKFVLRLSTAPASPVQISYSTIDSTAIAGQDYIANSGTLSFAIGQLTDTVRVRVLGDRLVEADEYFKVRLTSAVNATITQPVARGAVRNDDAYPRLLMSNLATPEGLTNREVMVQVRLARAYPETVRFSYRGSDSTATAGDDYIIAPGTIAFIPGDTVAFIPVTIVGDNVTEINEIFFINPSVAENCLLTTTTRARVTINNDDALPRVVFGNTSVSELSNDQWNTRSFPIRLNRSYPLPVTINFHTRDSTAVTGQDYQPVSGTITFAPFDTLESIDISILGDKMLEGHENLIVELSLASNAVITKESIVIRINNDDALPAVILANTTVTESDAATTQAMFTVRLNKKYPVPVTVNYKTVNGTATAGADYEPVSSQLVFAANDSVETIAVNVLPDLIDEFNETFMLSFSGAVNATIPGAGIATATIIDNDPVPAITINDLTIREIDGAAILTLRLSARSEKPVRVKYITQDGTAKHTLDFGLVSVDSVTIEPGQTERLIGISVYQDGIPEPTENFSVILTSALNASIVATQGGDNKSVVTILNSNEWLGRSVNPPTPGELLSNSSTAEPVIPTLVKRGATWNIRGLNNTRSDLILRNFSGQIVLRQSGLSNIPVLNLQTGVYVYELRVMHEERAKVYSGRLIILD